MSSTWTKQNKKPPSESKNPERHKNLSCAQPGLGPAAHMRCLHCGRLYASFGNVVAKFFALLVVMVTWAWCMLGECKNLLCMPLLSVRFGEFPTPSVGVFLVFRSIFLLWFSSFFSFFLPFIYTYPTILAPRPRPCAEIMGFSCPLPCKLANPTNPSACIISSHHALWVPAGFSAFRVTVHK